MHRLEAQSVDTDWISGPWKQGQAAIGWAGGASWDRVGLVTMGAWVPSGKSLIDWDSFSLRAYGAGFHAGGTSWDSQVFLGFSPPTEVPTHWNGNEYSWDLESLAMAAVITRTGDWLWGGANLVAGGTLDWDSVLDLGPFQAGGRVLFAGLPWLGGFFGEGDLNFQSDLSILGISPIKAEVSLQGWAGGLWADPKWSWRWGSFDLLGIGGLFWVTEGSWQITSFETVVVVWPPSITTTTSTSRYQLAANPGWFLFLRPTITWNWDSHWSLNAGRALPLVGGWRLTSGSQVLSRPASLTGSSLSTQTVLNGILAGTSVGIQSRW
jgi:hypothetical protein